MGSVCARGVWRAELSQVERLFSLLSNFITCTHYWGGGVPFVGPFRAAGGEDRYRGQVRWLFIIGLYRSASNRSSVLR